MARQTGNSECGFGQQRPSTVRQMSQHDACQCEGCSPFYSLTTSSPVMSACSSIQGDVTPCTIWSNNINPQTPELYQSPLDATYFCTPQTALCTAASPNRHPCLDQ